jgi:hypothetical protein
MRQGTQIKRPLMSLEEAILAWIIDTLQPFIVVEHPSFQRIFQCIHQELPLRNGDTIRQRIMGQFDQCYTTLRDELQLVLSVSLSLDAWTSPNYHPIFAIIGHWISPNWIKREALFEFTALQGIHSGENMAAVTWVVLHDLWIK